MQMYRRYGFSEKASGVVFESDSEPCRFYLAGDTVYFPGVVETIQRFTPGVIAVNCAGAQAPLGHLIIMNHYDVAALMHDFPDADIIATHLDGVSHATVSSDLLRGFKAAKGLERLWIPAPLQTLHFERQPWPWGLTTRTPGPEGSLFVCFTKPGHSCTMRGGCKLGKAEAGLQNPHLSASGLFAAAGLSAWLTKITLQAAGDLLISSFILVIIPPRYGPSRAVICIVLEDRAGAQTPAFYFWSLSHVRSYF